MFFQPCAFTHNAGYVLLDLDSPRPGVIADMRSGGHQPCVIAETSPGRLQAWVRVSPQPLAPAVATEVARHLAHLYNGDPASADWLHMGRLAGFTNPKPQRRLPSGFPPWVGLRHARPELAAGGSRLVEAATGLVASTPAFAWLAAPSDPACPPDAHHARSVYQAWLEQLRIRQRFSDPDWSIVDLWIAGRMLAQGVSAQQVKATLQLASPGFPRLHARPDDSLQPLLRGPPTTWQDNAPPPYSAR